MRSIFTPGTASARAARIAASVPAAGLAAVAAGRAALAALDVLVVEDDADTRDMLAAAVGLSAAALVLLLWIEVAVWRAVTPVPPTMQPQEVGAILADVSASLFSLTGGPVGAASTLPAVGGPDDQTLTLEAMAQELDSTLMGGEP